MNEEILKSYPAISEKIINAVDLETKKFLDYYLWLESAMPNSFFAEVDKDKQLLIAHNLVGFDLQDFFSIINLKTSAIVLCIDSPSSDLRILKHFEYFGIKEYQSYISRKSMPFEGSNDRLRLAIIDFIGAKNKPDDQAVNKDFSNLFNKLENDKIFTDKKEFNEMVQKIGAPFLKSQTIEKQIAAINMYLRATSRDSCQYLVSLDKKWEDKKAATMHSMHITLAWRNTPKHNFLLKLAKVINRHNLSLQRLNASYTDSSKSDSILVMAICLHGSNGRPVWEEAEISDLLRELVTIKYYDTGDLIEEKLVNTHLISGNMGNFLRCSIEFIHQALSQIDSNLYTTENIEFDLCRHPELTTQVCDCFKFKFDPSCQDISQYEQSKLKFLKDLSQLDTGQEGLDSRRKNVLGQALSFIKNTLKTNFYRINYSAVCFRLDPKYLNEIPFDRSRKFPDIPYAIFYIKGMHFFGFHIRFKDLARGGLRTVYPDQPEHIFAEAKNVFTECYNLAWTQQKKNKDIPEGGAKGIIFIKAIDIISKESQILESEIIDPKLMKKRLFLKLKILRKTKKLISYTKRKELLLKAS